MSPKEVLVVGANGATGRRLVSLLAMSGFDVRAMIRDESQAPTMEELGGHPVVADLEGDVGAAVRGVDVVMFAAGSGAHTPRQKTLDVDRDAAIRLVDVCVHEDVERFVMLSSMGTRDPARGRGSIRHYLEAKAAADAHLQAADIHHTIVRPGRLTDAPGRGQIEAAEALDRRGEISRDDVAATMVTCLMAPSTIDRTFEVLAGDLAIGAALEEL